LDVTVEYLGKWMLLWDVWVNGCYCGAFR
jgi:hypothetical protein